jgi:predicted regulator of Ras-like GTPase activity (Roadblock/LC7/MglB family)
MDDTLVNKLEPYREQPGVLAALLVSRDGFLVAASADDRIDTEAIAAQVAGVIDIGARLAEELEQPETRYVGVELSGMNIVLAPFEGELLLALVGTPDAIKLDFRLRHEQ